jgi:hypothetical protein
MLERNAFPPDGLPIFYYLGASIFQEFNDFYFDLLLSQSFSFLTLLYALTKVLSLAIQPNISIELTVSSLLTAGFIQTPPPTTTTP